MIMRKRWTMIAALCAAATLSAWPLVPTATGEKTKGATAYPIIIRPDGLARGGAVLTMASYVDECARHGILTPRIGGGVIGIGSCDAVLPPGGWVQLERTFDAPYRPTV